MEWAATRADVINMSLGGSDPDDGNDPLSLAVDALSKQTGALFVIAAGNSGGAISSPGSAASALTVGAVDRNDKLADFSSRGPLVTSNVAKPELVAPGVDIVAARAAGTNLQDPIDRHYEAISGTSMASPHVAGAAALLVQRHPDWTGAQTQGRARRRRRPAHRHRPVRRRRRPAQRGPGPRRPDQRPAGGQPRHLRVPAVRNQRGEAELDRRPPVDGCSRPRRVGRQPRRPSRCRAARRRCRRAG